MSHVPLNLCLPATNIRKCSTYRSEYFQIKESCRYLLVYRPVKVYEETVSPNLQFRQR